MPSLITNKYVPNHRPNLNCPAVEDSRDLGLIFNKEPVENDYDILNDLGEGQYAKVRRVKHRTTGVHYAAKFVKKRRFATSRQGVPRPLIEREVQVLRLLGGHENVITLFDVYETSTEVIMILELVIGGELFDHVCEKECLPEVEAASFVKQILIGLRHLHQFNVVHLDVKPENIMLIRKGECKIKLIDFGLSRIIPPGTIVKDMIGTPEFVAPEVINYESLSSACDMWAVGVITYILLSNGSPFLGETREETFCNITGANYHLSDRYFGKVSEIAKDFIRNLLVVRQRKRLTVHEALEHPWIRGYFSVDCYQFKTPLSEISRSGKMLPSPKKTNKNLTAKEKWLKSFFKVRFINRLTIRTRTEIAKAKEAGVEMVHKYEEEEYIVSAVLIACEEGNYIGLEQLATRHEINLNVANKLGESSMHIAAGAGHDQVVLFLKSQGVPVNCQDRRGDTPLFWAARNGHAKIVRFLCRDKGVSINHVNKSGESALHVAARYAQITSLQTLLDCGANPNIQDETGESAMHIASWHGYSSALELLCKYKPNLHLNNQDDETALHCAAARGHLECVQCLLDDKAIVNARDLTGQTALHLALRRSHLDIAIVLITNSADIDIQDENGDTPLHIACRLGLGSTVQTLCHLQAKVDLKNNQSLTPLHIACAEEDIEIVRCLIVSKANVNCQTKDKQTAEDIAISKNNVEIASLLGKMKSTSNKNLYIDQLDMKDGNLKRIKLKIFGHCGTGKTKLVSAFANSGVINDFIGAVTKRFSDNLSLSPNSQSASASMGAISLHSAEEGYHSCGSSASSSMSEALHNNNLQKSQEYINGHSSIAYFNTPVNEDYTRGIDVQNINIHGAGEFSVWEFGGYEPYHIAYDHFVGNNECIHVVTFNSTEGPEIVYKQVLYWMNFLKGRVTQNEPIGHCGIVSKRSKVVLVGSHATDKVFPNKNSKGEYISSDLDAMLKTIKLRFETQFNIHDSLILLDSTNVNCNGMKAMKLFLKENREQIVKGLPPPLNLLDQAITFVQELRKEFEGFPVIPYSDFTTLLREEVNPLVSGSFSRRLVQQLQLIGEIVYLRDGATEIDLVILSPQWLGNHIIGQLFSAGHLSGCRKDGVYTIEEFGRLYPEISDPRDLLNVLDTLQLCVPMDLKYKSEYEFPGFVLKETPDDCWKDDKKGYVYGGMKIQPNRGMERSVQSFFPRIQAALRRSSIHDFHDPMDGDITQWTSCSKLNSGTMEAMIKLKGDAIEILVRGPPETDTSCFFFMEDIANMIEHTAFELCPGIPLERHFFSPKHLKEHRPHPATFGPEVIMQMQLNEQVSIKSSDDEEESFYDVVCFGSEVVASTLILGVDVSISNLKMASRCELASLLDPADSMGRDWSILAVKLNMTDQIESVDSTGQVLSRTDQLLCEWALHSPETATVGRLCTILAELGRKDARDALFRTVPLYSYSTLEELNGILPFEEENCSDSGVVSSTFSSREEPRSLSR